MIIPYGTDAPVYHRPVATVVIILLNSVVFAVQVATPHQRLSYDEAAAAAHFGIDAELLAKPGWVDFALSHGDGLHPVQWFTSFWMHASATHLIGNMIFLWVFGLVIEGKLGAVLFTAVYCGIGVLQNLLEQIICLGMEPNFSLGASSVIFGMIVLAMFWAPHDNIQYLVILFFQMLDLSIPILIAGFLYLFVDLGAAIFSGFAISTSMLHVMGAGIGLIPAVLFLKFNLVDCEQRDVISMFRDAHGIKPKSKKPDTIQTKRQELADKEREKEKRKETTQLETQIDARLASGDIVAAQELLKEGRRKGIHASWTRQQTVKLIQLYQKDKNWSEVIRHSQSYINQFAEGVNAIRINLARVYLVEKEYPGKAMKVLKPILNSEELTLKQRQMMQAIVERAQKSLSTNEFQDE